MGKDRYIRDVIKVTKRLADPDTFELRQSNHYVCTWVSFGTSHKITMPQTPSCYRGYENMLSTLRSAINDNELDNIKAFKGASYLRQDLLRKSKKGG